MRGRIIGILAGVALLPFGIVCQEESGLKAYKDANFEVAIPLLQDAVVRTPNDPVMQAALLFSLVYEGRVDDAAALNERLSGFPDSPEVLAARGEFAFYVGDMARAEHLFRAAIKLKEDTPRAVFGLSRLLRAASFYRTARLTCLKAHEIAPDDALITKTYLAYAPAARRQELLPAFAKTHPWLYEHYQEDNDTNQTLPNAIEDKPLFETEGGPQETTLHFVLLMYDATHPRAVGLEFKMGDGPKLRMLFDTGASGIVLKQSAVDKAGLEHMGSGLVWGAGDKGERKIFSALANSCELGSLKFRNCLVRAMEKKRRISDLDDGLIGADFFRDYVLQIDFQKRLLHLKPLPPRPPSAQGYDRAVAPDEANFTPVFREGHWLLITTHVNKKATGLFLLDTGAQASAMDSTFAGLSTKIHGNDWMRVSGVSGSVKNVYEADKADLQFGHFEQNNVGLTTYNLNNMPEHQEIRLAGILGLPVLQFFRLTIDYRNGLVNFDYVYK